MATLPSIERLPEPAPVASWRHTRVLVALFVVLAACGVLLHGRERASGTGHPPNVVPLYLSLIAAEWLLFRAVAAGVGSTGTNWRVLLGRASFGWRNLAGDALSGVLLCAGWVTVVLACSSSSSEGGAAMRSLLPRTALETALWVLLALSAGFCEEITFRGYFQAQFEALTRSKGMALIMQAALFGLGHTYEGLSSALAIVGYGVLFGVLALWRRSLRPAMLAHALTDLILGLVAR